MLIYFNCKWVDTRCQQYSTQLHTNCTQNTENGTYVTIKEKIWKMRAGPRICELYPGICLTTKEKAWIQVCIDTRGHHFIRLQVHSDFPNADLQKSVCRIKLNGFRPV
jgi:hypothetical protein